MGLKYHYLAAYPWVEVGSEIRLLEFRSGERITWITLHGESELPYMVDHLDYHSP